MKLTANFSLAELTRTSQNRPNAPADAEVQNLIALAANVLQPLRDALGKPVRITSGYRSEAVNRAVGGSATSQHRLGQAADIQVDGMAPAALAKAIVALALPYDQLIQEPTWVHVSYGPRNRREKLTAKRAGGKMVYTPGLGAG